MTISRTSDYPAWMNHRNKKEVEDESTESTDKDEPSTTSKDSDELSPGTTEKDSTNADFVDIDTDEE